MYNHFQVFGLLVDYTNKTESGLLKVKVRRQFKNPFTNEFDYDDLFFTFYNKFLSEELLEAAKGKKVILKGHLEPSMPRVDKILLVDNLFEDLKEKED